MTQKIRTPKGKLFGTLDVKTYILITVDGKNIRYTPLPREGCTLLYQAGESLPETIVIPPQENLNS